MIQFVKMRLKGYHPVCDKCLDMKKKQTKISSWDYFTKKRGKAVYCDGCWNWLHLKRGICGNCKSSFSHRSEEKVSLKKCGCGETVELRGS